MPVPSEVSPEELARILGITSRAVSKLSEQGILVRASRGRYAVGASVKSYIRHREAVAVARITGKDDSYAAALKARTWEQARKLADERAEREGALVRTDLLLKHWSSLLVAFKAPIFAMPRKLATQLARLQNPAECEALCMRELTQIMNRLSRGDWLPAGAGRQAGNGGDRAAVQ